MNMISIIIATYNSGKTLRRALDSVLNQSYQDWECIVVDGASKDNTIDIVKEFVNKDSRFRYISEPDHGIYDAFNKGWKMANGEWMMYLGSDDEYTKDGIKALMENSDGADVVYGDTYIRFSEEKPLKIQYSSTVKQGGFCCHQSLIMKRELIKFLGGFDEQYEILADKDLICKVVAHNCGINKVNSPISIFSLEGVSTTSYKKILESYQVNKKYLPRFRCVYDLSINTLKFLVRKYLRN